MRFLDSRLDKNYWSGPGIYVITCIDSCKNYIGSSKDIMQRLIAHRFKLRNNIHPNQHLQNSYNKNGENRFCWEIIEKCEIGQLLHSEKKWIAVLDSVKLGFNIREEPSSNFNVKCSARSSMLKSLAMKKHYENNPEARARQRMACIERKAHLALIEFLKINGNGNKFGINRYTNVCVTNN